MPVALPLWWLREVERHTIGLSLSELAADLSRAVRREPAWDRSTVGKFLKNEFPTFEMMVAFCKLFDLPPPQFVARSYEEAVHLAREARKYDDVEPNPEIQKRRDALNAAREHLEAAVRDQTQKLDSLDAKGAAGRRRPRGVVRGRSTPS